MTGPPTPVLPRVIYAAYAVSLAWLAAFAGVAVNVAAIAMPILADLVHGEPVGEFVLAVMLNLSLTPIYGLMAGGAALLVLVPAQCFQAAAAGALVRRFGDRAQAGVLLLLPVTAVIAWCCFDRFLANERSPDGLTAARYLRALAFQAPATLFSVAYAAAGRGWVPRRTTVVLLGLAAAVAGGAVGGGPWPRLAEEE